MVKLVSDIILLRSVSFIDNSSFNRLYKIFVFNGNSADDLSVDRLQKLVLFITNNNPSGNTYDYDK